MTAARWRAPADDGGVLADPPLDRARLLLETNRRRFARAEVAIAGTSLAEWRFLARRSLAVLAQHIAAESGEAMPAIDPERPVLMAGHQPELFHPGVWVKNFALHGLARQFHLNPINLVVDNDAVKSTALRLPAFGRTADGIDPATVRTVAVPFDRPGGDVPYELRPVRDPALFASFPERVAEKTAVWGFAPLLPALWADVLAHPSPRLGERFAAARRALERRWGCRNVEVPLSRVCELPLFEVFAGHILADLPRFHRAYNTCVRAYRRANGIRSRHHPVPDLAADGDWLEAPFWAWRDGSERRGRLFARPADRASRVELRAAGEPLPGLERRVSLGRASYDWRPPRAAGWRVRSRALTTTMFARLFLCDAFIHGIGGGKYDELTDQIIRHFFGVEPPAYLVLSATLRLPLPAFAATPAACRRLQRAERDLHWNPQRCVSAPALAAERERWRALAPPDSAGRRERFRQLQRLTAELRALVPAAEFDRRRRQRAACERELAANAVLRRRDYSFALYPEALLREYCTRFLG